MDKDSVKSFSPTGVDLAGARTVVAVAQHMQELREAATHLQSIFDTRERGYFTHRVWACAVAAAEQSFAAMDVALPPTAEGAPKTPCR